VRKKSNILEALSLYDQDKILDLCKVLLEKKIPFKKAAGEDVLFSSTNNLERASLGINKTEVKKKSQVEERHLILVKDQADLGQKKKKKENVEEDFRLNSELLMWQREASKEIDGVLKKSEAVKGYKQLNQLYVVKEESEDGKNKLKFASTHGVLIDKKQD
jgi:hypothetical protein